MPNDINPSDPMSDEAFDVAVAPSGVKRRLFLSFAAGSLGPVVSLIFQILNVPVFLRFWGPELYGEWILLSAIPTYLAMSDMGFGTVAANDMAMKVGRADYAGAVVTFQSTFKLITLVSLAIAAIVVPLICFMPLDGWLKLHQITTRDARLVLIFLAIDSLACLQTSLSMAGFKSTGLNHYSGIGINAIRVVEGIGVLLLVSFGRGPVAVAILLMSVRAIGNLLLAVVARRSVPWLRFGFKFSDWSTIRSLFKPAVSFMAFPAAAAMMLQGAVLAIGVVLGPAPLAVFSPMRTMTRAVLQLAETMKNTVWPELSTAFGAGNLTLSRKLHRIACQIALILSCGGAVMMAAAGPWIFRVWTHGRVPIDEPTFYLLIAGVILYSLWNTSSVVLIAANRHSRIAVIQLAAAVGSLAVAIVLMRFIGLAGAAAGLLLGDATMVFAVLPASVSLLQDHLGDFGVSLFDVGGLLNRFRLRPGLSRG